MSEVFIQVGSGLAIVLGLVHLVSTRAALRGATGLSSDDFRMIVMQWVGVGYMLLFLKIVSFVFPIVAVFFALGTFI